MQTCYQIWELKPVKEKRLLGSKQSRKAGCSMFGGQMDKLDDVGSFCLSVGCTAAGSEAGTGFGVCWCSQFCSEG